MTDSAVPTFELRSEEEAPQVHPDEDADSDALSQISLKLIDDLREHGVDKDIELPQIIVCGNQSCGKSSVLEAICGLSFPRGDGFCTAFATELSLRRGSRSNVEVRIPSIKFEKNLDSLEDFGPAVEAAKKALRMHHGAGQKTIFKEKLQIRVSHPSWPPLNLVDLPGLIGSLNFGQDKQDMATIRDIVQKYMSGSKTIILAVVSGKDEAANQSVLDLAHSCDPLGTRTIGVITKPDLVRPGTTAEVDYVGYALNTHPSYKFTHWHVVKNRDDLENCSLSERDEREAKFFSGSIWEKSLTEKQLGIDALRIKLSTVLHEHIRRELPGVVSSLCSELNQCRAEIARLGPSRESIDAQEDYLMHISQQFQDVVKQATDGRYDDADFFTGLPRKLRALVEDQNEEFVRFIYSNGHSYEDAEVAKKREKRESTTGGFNASPTSPALSSHAPQLVSRTRFIEMVREIQRDNRGIEFPGTFNPYHINILFRQQAQPWREIAGAHITNIWSSAVYLIRQAVESVTSGQTAERLIQYLIQGEFGMDNKSMSAKDPSDLCYSMDVMRLDLECKLDEILRPYEKHHAVTHDPEYNERKRQLFRKNTEAEYRLMTKHISNGCADQAQVPEAAAFVSKQLATYEKNPDEFASNASEILDLMQIYYKSALRTFVDNIAVLVIENCLMYKLHQLLSIPKVRDMARKRPDLLSYLASEPKHIQETRALLQKKEKRLDDACKLCKRNLSVGYFQPSSTPPSRSASSVGFRSDAKSNITTPTHQRPSSFTTPSTQSEGTPLTIPSLGNSPFSSHKKADSAIGIIKGDSKPFSTPLGQGTSPPSNAPLFGLTSAPTPTPKARRNLQKGS